MGQLIGYSQNRQYKFCPYVLNILFGNCRAQVMTFALFLSITFGVLHTVRTVNEHNTNYTFSESKYYPTITRLFCFGTSSNRQCDDFCKLFHSYQNSSRSFHGKTIKKKEFHKILYLCQ